jgi:hypothetical protein
MRSAIHSFGEWLEAPTLAGALKIVVIITAFLLGMAGWVTLWAEAFHLPAMAAMRVSLGAMVLLALLGLFVLLGLVVDEPGLERVSNILVRTIAFLLGASIWLAFVGLCFCTSLLVAAV